MGAGFWRQLEVEENGCQLKLLPNSNGKRVSEICSVLCSYVEVHQLASASPRIPSVLD